jgi:hypothetical protein
MQGSQFLVCDPHYGAGEESLGSSLQSLRHLMPADVASNDEEILETVQYVTEVGQRRLQGQDSSKQPLILILDETTALLNRSSIGGELTSLVGMICQETRKVGVYAICLGQMWKGRSIDTTLRDSFASILSCPSFGNNLGNMVDGDAKKMISRLAIGQAVYYRIGYGAQVLNVPNCTSKDVQMVVSGAFPTAFHGPSAGLPPERILTDSEGRGKAVGNVKESRVAQMINDGFSRGQIIRAVWGVTAGRAYMDAGRELDVMVESLRERGLIN